jgi:hypothetical protein
MLALAIVLPEKEDSYDGIDMSRPASAVATPAWIAPQSDITKP